MIEREKTSRMKSHTEKAQRRLQQLRLWASERDDVRALVLVGSFARGEARPDSDLDVVLVTNNQHAYLDNTDWVSAFGRVGRVELEPYGTVTSVRAFYDDGLEIEFGIAPASWAAKPFDAGTEQVARQGIVVLLDRDGHATDLANAVAQRPNPIVMPFL
jgi:predicted nucleotidyltransferase